MFEHGSNREEEKKKTSDNQRHIKINLIIHVEMKTHIYTIKHLFTLDPLNRVDEPFPNCFIDVLFTKLLCCWMELNEAYRERASGRVSAHLAAEDALIWSRVHKHLGPPLLITITSIIAILTSLYLFYFISFCLLSPSLSLSISLFPSLSRPLHFIVIIII